MNGNDHNSRPTPDQIWEAARYVWGELSPAEAAAFAARLATDELACAALAEAVTLSVGLQAAAARPSPVPRPERHVPSSWGRKLAAWTCAAAALAAGIALVASWRQTPAPTMNVAAVELIDRWMAENHAGLHAEFDLRDDNDAEVEVLDESLSAPHWLVNAVQLTSDDSPAAP